MVTKTYRLKRYNSCSLVFTVGDRNYPVQFIGTLNKRGEFTTSNEELQKAMEESNSFKNDYTLVYTFDDSIANKKDNSEENESEVASSVELKEVTAKNLQGINDLVKELFPSYGKTFKSSEKAVAYFAENGYKLVIE